MRNSFETLKQGLTTAPVLAYPDFSKPFLVAMAASSAEVRAVLSQLDENGREHPMYCVSRSLIETEKSYSTTEREGLAIVFALKKVPITFCVRISSCSGIMKLGSMQTVARTDEPQKNYG